MRLYQVLLAGSLAANASFAEPIELGGPFTVSGFFGAGYGAETEDGDGQSGMYYSGLVDLAADFTLGQSDLSLHALYFSARGEKNGDHRFDRDASQSSTDILMGYGSLSFDNMAIHFGNKSAVASATQYHFDTYGGDRNRRSTDLILQNTTRYFVDDFDASDFTLRFDWGAEGSFPFDISASFQSFGGDDDIYAIAAGFSVDQTRFTIGYEHEDATDGADFIAYFQAERQVGEWDLGAVVYREWDREGSSVALYETHYYLFGEREINDKADVGFILEWDDDHDTDADFMFDVYADYYFTENVFVTSNVQYHMDLDRDDGGFDDHDFIFTLGMGVEF